MLSTWGLNLVRTLSLLTEISVFKKYLWNYEVVANDSFLSKYNLDLFRTTGRAQHFLSNDVSYVKIRQTLSEILQFC